MVIIDGFQIDAAAQERHSFESNVTEYPVEDGADIADHVRAQPIELSVQGIVTDTPIGPIAGQRSPSGKPSNEAFARLLEIRTARQPVTVETGLRTYKNMVLASLDVPRTARTGDALRFSATFIQVELVENQRTSVRVAVPRAAKKENFGYKPSIEREAGWLLGDDVTELDYSPIYFASKGFAGGAGGSF